MDKYRRTRHFPHSSDLDFRMQVLMGHAELQYLAVENGSGGTLRIAYEMTPAAESQEPGLVWLPGLKSDMTSTKVSALKDWAARTNRAMLRFDYSGHGASEGEFSEGTIGQWLRESLAVLRLAADHPQVLVGSSMGGWLALLILRAIANNGAMAKGLGAIDGAVLIAPAWDMTEELMWKEFPPEARTALETDGFYERPSRYGDGAYPISMKLIEEGRAHLIGGESFSPPCPVRIIQGINDPDVPWRHANRLTRILQNDDKVVLNLIQDGDHRLSRPQDIEKILGIVGDLYQHLSENRHYV